MAVGEIKSSLGEANEMKNEGHEPKQIKTYKCPSLSRRTFTERRSGRFISWTDFCPWNMYSPLVSRS